MFQRQSHRWGNPCSRGVPHTGPGLPAAVPALGSGRGSHARWRPLPWPCSSSFPCCPHPCGQHQLLLALVHLLPLGFASILYTFRLLEDLDVQGTRHGAAEDPSLSTANPVLCDPVPAHAPCGLVQSPWPPNLCFCEVKTSSPSEAGLILLCVPNPGLGPSRAAAWEDGCLLCPAGTFPARPQLALPIPVPSRPTATLPC